MKEKKNIRFLIADILLLAGAIIPLIFGVVLNILTTPASEGISISGALIYFTIPMPIQDLPKTESQVNSALGIIWIFFLCV